MVQHPVIAAAIDKLAKSSSPEKGITNVVDRSKATELFYALLDCGFCLERQPIYDQLVEYGWPAERANEAADLAELVSVDGYIKIDFPTEWGDRVVKKIMAELANDRT